MASNKTASAYIIAAKRTALGRVGGLHKSRRVEDLAAPVILAACDEAGTGPATVEEIIVGNATAGGNPARVIALASGLAETINATTIDQQDASGLVAIIQAARLIDQGEADVVVAGGAESLSTAPWRIARPRSVHQTPHFISPEPFSNNETHCPIPIEGTERLARELEISRAHQDAFAALSIDRAINARKSKRFVDEIVPLRSRLEEGRDQTTSEYDFDEIAGEIPFLEDDGTLTPANTSIWHDGAAFVVIVSENKWNELGRPPALKLVANAALGVAPDGEAGAPIAAVQKLYSRLNGFDRTGIGIVEISETSAVQAVAVAQALGFDEAKVNPEGGAIARGHPFAAAGAILVVRLFSQMLRGDRQNAPAYGLATQGAVGGLGVAALFAASQPH